MNKRQETISLSHNRTSLGRRILRNWQVYCFLILPTVIIMLILRTGSIMSVGYEKALLMQNTLNSTASEVISTYVYKVGLTATIPDY